MSNNCKYCGTVIMEDSIDYCPQCKPIHHPNRDKYFRTIPDNSCDRYEMPCPGCGFSHTITNKIWTLTWKDGKPTLSPSVLSKWGRNKENICHIFVRGGKIQYLTDCTHELAGKTIDMEIIT